MNKLFIWACLFFSPVPTLTAQVNIAGQIKDAATGEPLIGAHLFLTGTQLGTTSDENGFFELVNIPNGAVELVSQYIGYASWSKKIILYNKDYKDINIQLKALPHSLGVIDVKAKASNKRKRYLNRFFKAFIGTSSLAKKCRILNPEVLLFQNEKNILTATAADLLKIENRATGYLIYFNLEKFEMKTGEVVYAGKPLFQPLEPTNTTELKKWKKERDRAYLGSMAHFFKSLARDQLEEEGFEIRLGNMEEGNYFQTTARPTTKKIIKEGVSAYDRILTINQFLQVIYKNEKTRPNQSTSGNISLGRDHQSSGVGNNNNFSDKFQVSFLYALNPRVQFYTDGRILHPHLLKEYGHFSTERVAELIPSDYVAVFEKPKVVLNDFVLDHATIPTEEIKKGGPPRDGIPSIDRPVFIAPAYADFLQPEDRVLGVNYNGTAKAYPIRIMDWHEIVNDQFGQKKVAVTYCPLCGSGMAFNTAKIGPIGVSGLLYNSDVLLYDRETESLWSQILGIAISGEKKGTQLEYIATQQTSWADWQSKHPETLVLSTNTGYQKDYTQTPYAGYDTSEKLLFPVTSSDPSIFPKEKVIGLEIDGQFKAYPFSRLKKAREPVMDTFNQKEVQIVFNKKADSGEVQVNGLSYPFVSMYWFAWYAFHPDTAIFQ